MLSEVPEGWQPVSFEAVYQVKNNKSKQIKKGDYLEEGAYPVIDQSTEFIAGYQNCEPNMSFPVIIFGDHTRIVKWIDFPFLTGADGTQAIYVSKLVFPKFGYYALKNVDLPNLGYSRHMRELKRAQFLIPPLTEQKRIAEVLGSVDESIQATQRLIEQAERVKQGLMEELLTGGLGSEAIERGEVPEGWRVSLLGECCLLERGKFSARPRNDPKFYGGDYPFIQTGEVANAKKYITGFTQTLNEEGLKVSRVFPAGTLLMSIAANVGNVGIVKFETAAPDSIVSITPYGDYEVEFFYYLLSFNKRKLESIATQNAQANLNLEKLNKFNVLIPNQAKQQEVVERLRALDAVVARQELQVESLQLVKKGLMDDLLTGKVRTV